MTGRSTPPAAVTRLWPWIGVLVLMLGSLLLHLWGVRQDLPFEPDIDEPDIVRRAVAMAATPSLNPGWFGHPASTLLYPLAAIYRSMSVVGFGGPLLGPDPGLLAMFDQAPGDFYLLGRLLSIGFAVATVPLVYVLGSRLMGPVVGLVAAALVVANPVGLYHAQLVRTDSAGMFFATLALIAVVEAHRRGPDRADVLFGVALGLAVSTRYFLATLALPYLAVLAFRWWSSEPRSFVRSSRMGLVAFSVAGATFLVTTPFFIPELRTVIADLRFEARSTHPGADGLSPLGNLLWYLTSAAPGAFGWPQLVAAGLGSALALHRREAGSAIALLFLAGYLATVSLSPLHWARYLIPITPVVAIMAATSVDTIAAWISEHVGQLRTVGRVGTLVLLTSVLVSGPLGDSIEITAARSRPSTRVEARFWMIDNIEPGAAVAQELYTAPLAGTTFRVERVFSLSERTLAEYREGGFRYVMASSSIWNRFIGDPERYPVESGFYDELDEVGHLLVTIEPHDGIAGPVIRVYDIGSTR